MSARQPLPALSFETLTETYVADEAGILTSLVDHTKLSQADRENISQAALALVATLRSDGQPCLLYTSPSPRDLSTSRMPSSA